MIGASAPAALLLAGGAAIAAGLVNALAGGGSLITFPALVAMGVPPLVANVTNTVALCPGYLGATLAQRADLAGQGRRLAWLLPAGAAGGLAGALLLLHTSRGAFAAIVPVLLIAAAFLIAAQEPLRRLLVRRAGHRARSDGWAAPPVALAAIYGGYFGAGLGVITLAVLGLVLDDELRRLNATKQTLSLAINVTAAAVFAATGPVRWPLAAVMAVGALVGGVAGGRLAGKIRPTWLRGLVVAIAVGVALAYLVR